MTAAAACKHDMCDDVYTAYGIPTPRLIWWWAWRGGRVGGMVVTPHVCPIARSHWSVCPMPRTPSAGDPHSTRYPVEHGYTALRAVTGSGRLIAAPLLLCTFAPSKFLVPVAYTFHLPSAHHPPCLPFCCFLFSVYTH